MPALTRRRLLLEHADRIDAHGARRREDAIRVGDRAPRGHGLGRPDAAPQGGPAGPVRPGLPPGRAARRGPPSSTGSTPEAGLAARRGPPRARGVRRGRRGAHRRGRGGGRATIRLARAHHRDPLPQPDVGAAPLGRGARGEPGASATGSPTRRRRGAHAERGAAAQLLRAAGSRRSPSWNPLGDLDRPRLRALRALAEVPALIAVGQCDHRRRRGRHRASGSTASSPTRSPSRARECTSSSGSTPWPNAGRLAEAAALAGAAYDATPANGSARRLHVAQPPARPVRAAVRAGRDGPALAGRGPGPLRGARQRRARSRLVLSTLATAHACAWATRPRAAPGGRASWTSCPRFPFVEPEQELGRAWALVAVRGPAGRPRRARVPRPTWPRRPRLPATRGLAPPRRRAPRRPGVGGRPPRRAAPPSAKETSSPPTPPTRLPPPPAAPDALVEATDRFERHRGHAPAPPRPPTKRPRRSSDAATGGRRPPSACAASALAGVVRRRPHAGADRAR